MGRNQSPLFKVRTKTQPGCICIVTMGFQDKLIVSKVDRLIGGHLQRQRLLLIR